MGEQNDGWNDDRPHIDAVKHEGDANLTARAECEVGGMRVGKEGEGGAGYHDHERGQRAYTVGGLIEHGENLRQADQEKADERGTGDRKGDHLAVGVACFFNLARTELIADMARETIKMVTASVDAFVKKDVALAEAVLKQDDIVDDCFSKVKHGIITLIAQNSADGELALDLLMISKYFERIGDHATNIAEWVIYSVTGAHKEA